MLDFFSQRGIGGNLEIHKTADLAITALQSAIIMRQPPPSCIHHAMVAVNIVQRLTGSSLFAYGFLVSMSRKGNCWENAVTESFFEILKAELLWA